jgi:hypothetical protein
VSGSICEKLLWSGAHDAAERQLHLAEIERLDREVAKLRVDLAYADKIDADRIELWRLQKLECARHLTEITRLQQERDAARDEVEQLKLGPVAVEACAWYMHDNHTFTRLRGNVDAVVAKARALGVESPYGMLSRVRLIGSNEIEIRSVGDSVHAREGFVESELFAWRDAVMADPEASRLLAAEAKESK